jgi:protoporphyrinogen oxidase
MDALLGREGWLHHERESWVWMRNRFIPYPFQNNIHRLPVDELERCLDGLIDVITHKTNTAPQNFRDWIVATFGQGVTDAFLAPYNFKVWAYPPELLNVAWVGERVAVPDLKRIVRNLLYSRDDISWGPNSTFRFPLRGGTGAIWRACAARLPSEHIRLGDPVVSIDAERRRVTTRSGQVHSYDALLSTMPLTELLPLTGETRFSNIAVRGLKFSSTHIFGIGLRGNPPERLRTKCWMYFPEDDCPYYRVTVFSNYSPYNVPQTGPHWSLMAEVSESPEKPLTSSNLGEQVIEGMLDTGLIHTRGDIVSKWRYKAQYGYPTPGLDRDAALSEIVPHFEALNIFPRGRFGLWKYEVSNQDHSFMQGVEWVERVTRGQPEMTASDPTQANSRKHPWPYDC